MASVNLNRQFFQTSRGRIVNALRRGESTVDEIASALGQTSSAVRAQIRGMERDGLIEAAGIRPGTTRPFAIYRLTPEVQHLLSRAYIPLLNHLVRVFAARQPPEEFESVMREAGRALAADLGFRHQSGSLDKRVAAASELLNNELGALTHVTNGPDGLTILGSGCPLAALTDKHQGVCRVIESLLEECLGTPVEECCDRDERPRCCFRVRRARA